MHVHDVLSNFKILFIVFLIENDEEQVEAGHNGWRNIDVVAEGLLSVVPAHVGVGSSQYGGPSVERRMNSSLSNRDSLLLHSFVNSCLIFGVHLVELVNATDTVVCKHQRTRFNTVLTGLHVFAHGSCQTGSAGALTRCVDSSWQELTNVLQELGLGSGRVTHDANIDVASKFDTVLGTLANTTE